MKRASRFIATVIVLTALSPCIGRAHAAWAQTLKHNCSFCHNLHGGSYTALSDWQVTEDLCLSCHGDAGPGQVLRDGVLVTVPKNVEIHNGNKHTAPTTCWTCHNHEGEAGGNLAMIQANMPTPSSGTRSVAFTARTGAGSFADDTGAVNHVCEVCHTLTNHYRNDGTLRGAHNARLDCTTCHKHSGGFAGGGRCTGCHNVGQNARRPIVGEFGRTSHHVSWANYAVGKQVADSIPDATCTVCHDQSTHQQGTVRLWNVDTGASIALTGDPGTIKAEAAKLSTFCIACHDTNGANGNLTPLSDAVTRPLIDATAWNAASHNTSAAMAGCFGDGNFGCHASGHGSQKRNMLAPSATAAVAPALAEEQEGFCFNCHKSGGTSTINIASLFAPAIRWVQTATGLNNNPNLNDRHDIQYPAQSRSGAKIECTDCHNPHVANAARPYVRDPDTTDGHLPGTNYYFYSATNDTLSEFCLDCHDGSFPAGVLGHTSPQLVNIRTTWANDGMGARTSSNINVRPGNGWGIGDILACKVCHTPHPRFDIDMGTTTLFSVVDTVKDKAGTAFLPFIDRGINTFVYGITDNNTSTGSMSGAYWCNTCHDRTAMVGKTNCFSCHRHGDGGRF